MHIITAYLLASQDATSGGTITFCVVCGHTGAKGRLKFFLLN